MTVITQDRFGNHGERLEEGKMQARVQLDVPFGKASTWEDMEGGSLSMWSKEHDVISMDQL